MGRKSTGGAQAGDGGLEFGSKNAFFLLLYLLKEKKCQKETEQLTLDSDYPVQTFRSLSVGYATLTFSSLR